MSARAAVVGAVLALAAGSGGAAVWGARARLRHLAVPVLSASAEARVPGAAEPENVPGCRTTPIAALGGRVTALLPAADGALWIGTFDGGLFRAVPGAAPAAVPGLDGRFRMVNALAEHGGIVWTATQGGLLGFRGGIELTRLLEGEGVAALVREGEVLYAGTGRGLFRVTAALRAEPVPVVSPEGAPLRINALAVTEGGRLVLGTSSGAYSAPLVALSAPVRPVRAAWHPLVFGDPPAETNVVTALAPLGAGVIAGTDDGGLVTLDGRGRASALRFAAARLNEVNPGAAAAVGGGAALGTRGGAALGTQLGGLLLAHLEGESLAIRRPDVTRTVAVSAIWGGPGGMLVGTAEGAVLQLDCP